MALSNNLSRAYRISVAVLVSLTIAACSGAPDCSAGDTTELLDQIVDKSFADAWKSEGVYDFVEYKIKNIRKLGYHGDSDTYSCSAVLVVSPKNPEAFNFKEVEKPISYKVYSFQDDSSNFEISYEGVSEARNATAWSIANSPSYEAFARAKREEEGRKIAEADRQVAEEDAKIQVGACVEPRKMRETATGPSLLDSIMVYEKSGVTEGFARLRTPITRSVKARGEFDAYVEKIEVSDRYDDKKIMVVNGWIRARELRSVDTSRCPVMTGASSSGQTVVEPAASTGGQCLDRWIAAYRQEVGEEAMIKTDQIGEWESWCKQGKSPK